MDWKRGESHGLGPGGGTPGERSEPSERSERGVPKPGPSPHQDEGGRHRRRYSAEEKHALLVALDASGESTPEFAARLTFRRSASRYRELLSFGAAVT